MTTKLDVLPDPDWDNETHQHKGQLGTATLTVCLTLVLSYSLRKLWRRRVSGGSRALS